MESVRSAPFKYEPPIVNVDKGKNKVAALLEKVREKTSGSPGLSRKIRLLKRGKDPVVEPVSRPKVTHVTPTNIWAPAQIQEAKSTIASLLEELADLIPRTKLSITDKRKHALTYLRGLMAILKAGVGHLDLKPANILWDKSSFVISDFNASIIIDEVWKLTDSRFIFDSEEEKSCVRRIVQHLLDPDPKPLKSPHLPSIQKLVDFEILTTSALEEYSKETLYDRDKLRALKEYTATQFLPPPTRGYATNLYYNAMCNYFWKGEKENFSNACYAFDMRAAALTIYGIFTGAHPPEKENDREYYDTLEQSLATLGLSRTAAHLIRRMAEPTLPPKLPVTFDELQTLINELDQSDTPPIQVEFSEEESVSSEEDPIKKRFDNVQATLEQLTLLHGKEEPTDDQSIIRIVTEELLGSKANSSGIEIAPEIRNLLVKGAFSAYAAEACESVIEGPDDKTYNTVLLLDPTDLQSCDVVIKEKIIGEGGSAVVYKAFSLRSSQYVVLKYFLETAHPLEASKAKVIIEHICKHSVEHEAIQPCPKLFSLQVKEGYQKVTLEPYYANCDYASCIFGDLFCSKWKIQKVKEPILTKLKELDTRLQEICSESPSSSEKQEHIDAFEREYRKTFTGILGQQKAMSLFSAYRILATAIPTSRLRSVSIGYQDVDEITELVHNCFKIVPYTSVNTIDTEALRNTIDKADPAQKKALKKRAKELMIRNIRKCQGLVLREWLEKNSQDPELPLVSAKLWEDRAKTFGKKNLDLNGLNIISTMAFQKVKPIEESIPQKALSGLNMTLQEIKQIK